MRGVSTGAWQTWQKKRNSITHIENGSLDMAGAGAVWLPADGNSETCDIIQKGDYPIGPRAWFLFQTKGFAQIGRNSLRFKQKAVRSFVGTNWRDPLNLLLLAVNEVIARNKKVLRRSPVQQYVESSLRWNQVEPGRMEHYAPHRVVVVSVVLGGVRSFASLL